MTTHSLFPLCELVKLEILDCNTENKGLPYWIASKDFFLFRSITNTKHTLSIYTQGIFNTSVASDCNRLAMAACESFSAISNYHIKMNGLAWAIIRLYYASFFAAHATMRLFGHSCTNISHEHAKIINEILNIADESEKIVIKKGNYAFDFSRSASLVDLSHTEHSHNAVWNLFIKMLENIRSKIDVLTTTTENKIIIYDSINCILEAAGKSSRKTEAWLSNFRNSVNYQQTHRAWYPNSYTKYTGREIPNIKQLWNQADYRYCMQHTEGIESFFARTEIILRFFYEIFISAKTKNGGCGKLFQNGTFKILNLKR